MAVRRVPVPFDGLPAEYASAASDGGLSVGLVSLVNAGSGLLDLAGNTAASLDSAANVVSKVGARGAAFGGVSNADIGGLAVGSTATSKGATEALSYTAIALFDPFAITTASGGIVAVEAVPTTSQSCTLTQSNSVNLRFSSVWAFTTETRAPVAFVVTRNDATGNQYAAILDRDGVIRSASRAWTYGGARVRLGRAAALDKGYLVAIWDRVLSDAEILEVVRSPWQLFEARALFVPVASSGAGAALDASASASASATATLSTQINLAASATVSATASAALTTSIRLDASASASVVAAADLTTTPAGMAAAAIASATATASLSTSIRVQATATASATAAASLLTSIRLVASATASASASADLTTGAASAMSAAAVASAIVAAELTTQILMSAAAQSSVMASANLSTGSTAYEAQERFTINAARRTLEVRAEARTQEIGAAPRRTEVRN